MEAYNNSKNNTRNLEGQQKGQNFIFITNNNNIIISIFTLDLVSRRTTKKRTKFYF